MKIRFADAESMIKSHYDGVKPEVFERYVKAVSEIWEECNLTEMTVEEFFSHWNEWLNKQ